MKVADDFVPLAVFVVGVVGLVVYDKKVTGPHADSFSEIGQLQFLGRRLRSKHLCHDVGFFVIRAIRPFVELLDVGQEKCPLRMGLLRLTTHYAVEIPKDFEFLWYYWVYPKDLASCEVILQSLKDNHVWSEKEECLSVVLGNFVLFPRGIQELPRNGQRHHFGLTAARRHLDAIAGEAVVGRQPQVGGSCRISFEQRLPAADFLVFPNENQSLNSFVLRMVVLERTASR